MSGKQSLLVPTAFLNPRRLGSTQNPGSTVHPHRRSTLRCTRSGQVDHHNSPARSHALRYAPVLPVYIRPKRRRPFRRRPYCRSCKKFGHDIAYCYRPRYRPRATRPVFPATKVCHTTCCTTTLSSPRLNATVTHVSAYATPIMQATPRIMQAPQSHGSFHTILMIIAAIFPLLTRSAAKIVSPIKSLPFCLFATLHSIYEALQVHQPLHPTDNPTPSPRTPIR